VVETAFKKVGTRICCGCNLPPRLKYGSCVPKVSRGKSKKNSLGLILKYEFESGLNSFDTIFSLFILQIVED
jgi:hypothetical protein